MRDRTVIFIQGAGSDGAHREDAALASDLARKLESGYEVRYPEMPNEAEPDYTVWKRTIHEEVAAAGDGAVLVGHSIGGSVLVKLMTERRPRESLAGVFVVSAPFWHDHEFWRWKDAQLPADAVARFPDDVPLFLYHGLDDPFVPVAHVDMYARLFPKAIVHRLPGRDHQLNEDLSEVARDIKLCQA